MQLLTGKIVNFFEKYMAALLFINGSRFIAFSYEFFLSSHKIYALYAFIAAMHSLLYLWTLCDTGQKYTTQVKKIILC